MPRPVHPAAVDAGAPADDPGGPGARLRTLAGRALGSPLRLTVVGGSTRETRAAWRAVVAEFAAVDAALSRFRDDSELTALNRSAGSGSRMIVGRRLRTALVLMDRARRSTEGRFDSRVLMDLERLGERADVSIELAPNAGWPAEPARSASVPIVRMARDGAASIDRPVDSGGLGKGLALRWAAQAATRAMAPTAGVLLEAGGDVVAAGRPPEGGWRVGIEDPAATGASPLAIVRLDTGAITTSSVRVRRWHDAAGRQVHHLIDPATGEPGGDGLLAVTVAGSDPAWSEIHGKRLFLAGARHIGDEARAAGLAAWWVDEAGRLSMTPAGRLRSIWVAD